MRYDNVHPAVFLSRPNRFIAHCVVNGQMEICHVKNTGRCKELLLPGATVYVQRAANPNRSTKYDLIAVEKNNRLINMDSQIPNAVFREWAASGGIPGLTLIKSEQTHGASRFDFYLEADGQPAFVEVKGVTLEEDGVAMFPDAPTERGVKHVEELCRCVTQSFQAMLVFIIQMEGVRYFTPNDRTHPAFGATLRRAADAGVSLLALDCLVAPDAIVANQPVEIKL